MEDLKIIYLSPDELTPYENNTRRHNPQDIEGIKKSILAVGFDDPIGIWGEKNIIVEGHGRQIAAKELHLDKVPCIRLDHLTDEQRKEYAIRHNRSAEFSEWDMDALEKEIASLEIEGVDLSDLDFEFDIEPSSDEVEDGSPIVSHDNEKVAVRIVFENTKELAKYESKIRELVDTFENVSVSVGEFDEDK